VYTREAQLNYHRLDATTRLSLAALLATLCYDVGGFDKCSELRLQCVNDGAFPRAAAEAQFSLLVATGQVLQKRMLFGDAARMYERAKAVIPSCPDAAKNSLVLLLLLRQAELKLKLGEISSAGSIVLLPTEHCSLPMCSVAESPIVLACHARAETLCAEAYSILSDHIRAQSRVDIHSKRVDDDLDLSLLSWGLKPVMMQACACTSSHRLTLGPPHMKPAQPAVCLYSECLPCFAAALAVQRGVKQTRSV
jgi:hypothetical protein